MAIELISKIKPKNSGSFALVDAEDVELSDGRRLDEVLDSVGSGGGFVAQPEPPEDTSLLWIDTDDDTGTEVYSKAEVNEKFNTAAVAVEQKLKGYVKTEELPDVDIPDKLPNPYALTINGTSYDGSEAKTISITTDLSGYYTKTEVDAALGAYITDIDILVGGDA